MPNIVLSASVSEHNRDTLVAALLERLEPNLGKQVVVTHLRGQTFYPGAMVRTTSDFFDQIPEIVAICDCHGVHCLPDAYRAILWGQVAIEYFGIGYDQLEPLLNPASFSPELYGVGGFHGAEFRFTPATVTDLEGKPAPFAAVQSNNVCQGLEPADDKNAQLFAEHLRQLLDVELFLSADCGQMTEFLPKRQ